MRGVVLPLTQQQRVNRMLYLAQKISIVQLDEFVRRAPDTPEYCPDIYYLLHEYNGGKDPTAPDPADRWIKPGGKQVNRTCDCIGGMAWAGGWDRYQPIRFKHIYEGWINTDSMRLDAGGKMKCFIKLDKPEVGCYVVFASGAAGHKVGHIGGIVGLPSDFNYRDRDAWKAMKVVDCASRSPNPANKLTSGLTWFNTDAWFVRSVMQP